MIYTHKPLQTPKEEPHATSQNIHNPAHTQSLPPPK